VSELAAGDADRTPADTYKRAVRQVTGGMEAEVERNATRVRELREQLRELDRELLAADDRRLLVRIAANLAWEDTLEALWVESWITMRPFPRPDRFAKAVDPAGVMALAAEIERRAAELVAAVKGRRR
jgi:molybdopterin converting factor small subunit